MAKGFAGMTPERRREIASMGGKKSRRGPVKTLGEMVLAQKVVKADLV